MWWMGERLKVYGVQGLRDVDVSVHGVSCHSGPAPEESPSLERGFSSMSGEACEQSLGTRS